MMHTSVDFFFAPFQPPSNTPTQHTPRYQARPTREATDPMAELPKCPTCEGEDACCPSTAAAAAAGAHTADEEKCALQIRPLGKPPFDVSVGADSLLSDLRACISERLGGGHVRLLFKGKQLKNGSVHDAGLSTGSKVTAIFSSTKAVEDARALKEDVLLRGFEAKRNPPTNVGAGAGAGTPITSRSRPSLFDTLRPDTRQSDWRSAEALLRDLATHPGFYGAMQRRGYRVGALVEMYPEGRVGVDAVTCLGLNVNKGAEIHLRLRTDDLLGFRPLHKLYEVLAHELAHCTWSDHGEQFKAEMLAIQREAELGDWRYTRGRLLGSGETIANTIPGSLLARDDARTHGRRRNGARNSGTGTGTVNVGQSRLLREVEKKQKKKDEGK